MIIRNLESNTCPLIIHAPGFSLSKLSNKPSNLHDKLNPLWKPIYDYWLNDKTEVTRSSCSNELTVITWNSSDKKGILEDSLDRLGVTYITLKSSKDDWKNIYKIELLSSIIDSIKTPYVMALDSYDVLVLRDPLEAVKKFEQLNCHMLFNGEIKFYPICFSDRQKKHINYEWERFEKSIATSRFAYLNSGAWIAKKEFLKEFLAECQKRDLGSLVRSGHLGSNYPQFHQKITESDQALTHWIFKDLYPKIQIDHKTEIFLNIVYVPFYMNNFEFPSDLFQDPINQYWNILKNNFRTRSL